MSAGKIIGLGGVFIKFRDPKQMNTWYKEVLGLNTNDYGVLFAYNHTANQRAFLQLGTFPTDSDYFGEASQQVMLNFRVENLNALAGQLRTAGVKILDEIESYEYGSFLHISDPEGNRIELWEPIDSAFETSEPFQDMQ